MLSLLDWWNHHPLSFLQVAWDALHQSALTMLRWQNNKAAGSDYGDKQRYIDGESGNFKMERIMLKSDKIGYLLINTCPLCVSDRIIAIDFKI